MGIQRLGFGRLAWLAALDLDHLDGTKTQRPSGGRGALGVQLDEIGFRRPPKPADGDDGDLHIVAIWVGGSTDQIFSIL